MFYRTVYDVHKFGARKEVDYSQFLCIKTKRVWSIMQSEVTVVHMIIVSQAS